MFTKKTKTVKEISLPRRLSFSFYRESRYSSSRSQPVLAKRCVLREMLVSIHIVKSHLGEVIAVGS